MATDTAKVLETLGKMTVLELVELKKAIEEEWGVTAAAPVAVAAPARAAGAAATAPRPRRDGVRRRPHGRRRQEDPGDQGRPRGHRPRPQGGEGPRRRRPRRRQGGRRPGGGRLDQGAARGGRRQRRGQVTVRSQAASPWRDRRAFCPAFRRKASSQRAGSPSRGRSSREPPRRRPRPDRRAPAFHGMFRMRRSRRRAAQRRPARCAEHRSGHYSTGTPPGRFAARHEGRRWARYPSALRPTSFATLSVLPVPSPSAAAVREAVL